MFKTSNSDEEGSTWSHPEQPGQDEDLVLPSISFLMKPKPQASNTSQGKLNFKVTKGNIAHQALASIKPTVLNGAATLNLHSSPNRNPAIDTPNRIGVTNQNNKREGDKNQEMQNKRGRPNLGKKSHLQQAVRAGFTHRIRRNDAARQIRVTLDEAVKLGSEHSEDILKIRKDIRDAAQNLAKLNDEADNIALQISNLNDGSTRSERKVERELNPQMSNKLDDIAEATLVVEDCYDKLSNMITEHFPFKAVQNHKNGGIIQEVEMQIASERDRWWKDQGTQIYDPGFPVKMSVDEDNDSKFIDLTNDD